MTHPSSPPAPMTAERLYEVREQYRSGRWGDGLPRELFGHIDALTARVAELEQRARSAEERMRLYREQSITANGLVGKLESELAAARGAFDLSESERQRLAGRINATEARKVEDGDVQDAVDWLRDRAECSSITLDPAPMGPIADLLTRLSAALKEAERRAERAEKMHAEAFRIGIQHQEAAQAAEAQLKEVRKHSREAYDHLCSNAIESVRRSRAMELLRLVIALQTKDTTP